MLNDFLRINFPYGLLTNDQGKTWMVFNREYMPLGFNDHDYKKGSKKDHTLLNLPIFSSFTGLTEKILLSIAETNKLDSEGNVNTFFLYTDSTNPHTNPKYWPEYAEKLKVLSRLKLKSQKS